MKRGPRYQYIYTVKDAKTSEVICTGDRNECRKLTGLTSNQLDLYRRQCEAGKAVPYIVTRERIPDEVAIDNEGNMTINYYQLRPMWDDLTDRVIKMFKDAYQQARSKNDDYALGYKEAIGDVIREMDLLQQFHERFGKHYEEAK